MSLFQVIKRRERAKLETNAGHLLGNTTNSSLLSIETNAGHLCGNPINSSLLSIETNAGHLCGNQNKAGDSNKSVSKCPCGKRCQKLLFARDNKPKKKRSGVKRQRTINKKKPKAMLITVYGDDKEEPVPKQKFINEFDNLVENSIHLESEPEPEEDKDQISSSEEDRDQQSSSESEESSLKIIMVTIHLWRSFFFSKKL